MSWKADGFQVKVKTSHVEDSWTIVASYEGEREDVGFTLTVYSHRKASWVHAPTKLLYSKDVSHRSGLRKREATPNPYTGRRRVHAQDRRGQSHLPLLLPQSAVLSAYTSTRSRLRTRQQGCKVGTVRDGKHGSTHPCEPHARVVARSEDQRVRPAAPHPPPLRSQKRLNFPTGWATTTSHSPRARTATDMQTRSGTFRVCPFPSPLPGLHRRSRWGSLHSRRLHPGRVRLRAAAHREVQPQTRVLGPL